MIHSSNLSVSSTQITKIRHGFFGQPGTPGIIVAAQRFVVVMSSGRRMERLVKVLPVATESFPSLSVVNSHHCPQPLACELPISVRHLPSSTASGIDSLKSGDIFE